MQVFVIITDVGIMKSVYVNAKNWLTNGRWFIWNPSICEFECNKSCDIEQYLDYKNCKYRKKLISKLVEECSEDINGNEMIYNGTLNNYEKVCNSCTLYITLFAITFLIIIGISSAYFCFHCYLKRSDTNITNINANTETVIY